MLQLENETPFSADRAILLDRRGSQIWVVAVKATYRLDARGVPALHEAQEPVTAAPLWSGEPGRSSLLRDAELVVEHPGTDVTCNGAAWAPPGRAADHVDVGIMVGQVTRLLRVFGERVWVKGLAGLTATAPRPFERMPITWERAYGGSEGEPGGSAFAAETRNPIGRGFATSAASLLEKPLPNVEDPLDPIRTWRDRPAPAGLGAIPPDWSPRRERGGTCDERWRRTRMPLWPADYDARHHQSAPPGLALEPPLKGGELVTTTGLVPEGGLTFRLPREYLVVETRLGGQWSRQRVHLERVILEPDDRKLLLVWAARLDCVTRGREVERSRVLTKAWADL